MNFTTGTILFLLMAAYVALTYYQIKKIKEKIVKIMDGELEDKPLNMLINKAKFNNKTKFIFHQCISGIFFSLAVIVAMVVTDLYSDHEPDIVKYIIAFLSLIAIFSFNEIIKANSIWNLVRSKE